MRDFSYVILSFLSIFIGTDAYAQSGTCFDDIKLEPTFLALTSNKDSELGGWYLRLFDLEIAKEFSSPDGAVTGVLMHRGDFIVEVFYRADMLQTSDQTHESNATPRRGIMKVGIFTDANLLELQHCLKLQGTNAGRIFNDEKLGIDLLLVTDPDQNVLEIISRTGR